MVEKHMLYARSDDLTPSEPQSLCGTVVRKRHSKGNQFKKLGGRLCQTGRNRWEAPYTTIVCLSVGITRCRHQATHFSLCNAVHIDLACWGHNASGLLHLTAISSNRACHHCLHCSQFSVPDHVLWVPLSECSMAEIRLGPFLPSPLYQVSCCLWGCGSAWQLFKHLRRHSHAQKSMYNYTHH